MGKYDQDSGTPETSSAAPLRKLLARNSLILVGVEVCARGMGMVVFITMARMVGAADLGVYAFAVSLSNIAVLIPRFGFERYVQRELPRATHAFPNLWASIHAAKVPLSVIALVGLLLLLLLGDFPGHKMLIILLIFFSTLLYSSYVLFHAACFRAFQRAQYEALVRLSFSGLYVALGLFALWLGLGLAGVAAALVVAAMTAVAQSAWLLHYKIEPITFFVDLRGVRRVLIESLPLFLLLVSVFVYTQLDMLLLSLMAGDAEVGIYAAAMKVFEAAGLIPAGVIGAVLPSLAYDWVASRARFTETFKSTSRYLWMLSLPLAAGGTISAEPLLKFLYGPQYGPSIEVLRILIWGVVFGFWNHLLFAALVAMDREQYLLRLGCMGVVVNAAANLLLIPLYGARGCSIAVIATEAFLFFFALFQILQERIQITDLLMTLIHPAVCAATMVAVLWLILEWPLPLLLITGTGVYFGLLLLSGAVRWRQIKALFD